MRFSKFILPALAALYIILPILAKPIFAHTYTQDFVQKDKAEAFNCSSNPAQGDHTKDITPLVRYQGYEEIITGYRVTCTHVNVVLPAEKTCSTTEPAKISTPLGTIKAPANTVPTASGDPSCLVAGIVRGVISMLLIVAFIAALLWTMFAGYRFIFSGGDPKTVAAAWSQIYWGLLGLVIIGGAFGIIKLAEGFFDIKIVSDGLSLPRR